MRLSRLQETQYFDIWFPKWSAKYQLDYGEEVALLAKFRVGTHNEIVFTKTKSQRFQGHWYISGADVRRCKLGSNGSIPCYEVPVSKLQVLERGDPIVALTPIEPIGIKQLKMEGL